MGKKVKTQKVLTRAGMAPAHARTAGVGGNPFAHTTLLGENEKPVQPYEGPGHDQSSSGYTANGQARFKWLGKHTLVSIIRWMATKGADDEEARAWLAAFGIPDINAITLQAQMSSGRCGSREPGRYKYGIGGPRGPVADLTSGEASHLLSIRPNSAKLIASPKQEVMHENLDVEMHYAIGVNPPYRMLREVAVRPGQGKFRDSLVESYGCRCQVTGCTIREVIEAAHINPYCESQDDRIQNGLLLRADIHSLFDCDLLGINPHTLTVELNPRAIEAYGALTGVVLSSSQSCTPSREALFIRYKSFCSKLGS